MGNMICGATNNINEASKLEEIIKEEKIVVEEVVKEFVKEFVKEEKPVTVDEVVNEESIIVDEVVKEESIIVDEVVKEESVKVEEEPLDESVGSDSSSTTSSVNDTTPLIQIERVQEEPVKKKRGRKRKELSK